MMCVLSSVQIQKEVELGNLVIEPFDPSLLSSDALDLRLGKRYTMFPELFRIGRIDLLQQQRDGFLRGDLGLTVDTFEVDEFWLLPGEAVSAIVFERIALPLNLQGYVDGKSKWAQLGLVVKTAGVVHAGWKGILVLELRNDGRAPLKIGAGLPIAQIVFHTVI